jgi:hypothetical protein
MMVFCDPREIKDAWAQAKSLYLYTAANRGKYRSERKHLAVYLDRLRRVLAETVPGVGGLIEGGGRGGSYGEADVTASQYRALHFCAPPLANGWGLTTSRRT